MKLFFKSTKSSSKGQREFWRPYLTRVIDRYPACGDIHHGSARVKCRDGHHEYLLAFSIKRHH